jgi:hypothetical protein
MMKIVNIIFAVIFSVSLFSCKKKADPTLTDLGYNYFPINEGDYTLYDVVDSSFQGTDLTLAIVTRYQLKEEIHEPITVADEIRNQVYQYYRYPADTGWNNYPDSNWTEFVAGTRAVRIENNVRYVKLVFPLQVGKSWDGNISDPQNDPQNYYTMKNVKRPYSYDSLSYPSTVSVVQFDNSSALDDNYSVEVYAADRGLVYKEIKIYKYDQSDLLAQKVQYGRHYYKKLIGHGRYK